MGLESVSQKVYQAWSITMVESGRELHGPCPFCGTGKDRFIVWPEGNYFCRVCENTGRVPGTGSGPLGRDTLRQVITAKRVKQAKRLSDWQQGHREGFIEGYQKAMGDVQRDYWHAEGITDESIQRYGLGYCPERTFEGEGGQTFRSPAYTLPHVDPRTLQLVNCQYRIIDLPPGGGGKYRQEPGLPPASFWTLPKVVEGPGAVVVEGGKKAIVLSQLVNRRLQVIGLPGATPPEELYLELEGFDVLWFIFDPGKGQEHSIARAKAETRAKDYLRDRVRIVSIPVKPDDAVVQYGYTVADFRELLAQAR